jgi:hypothetical protein
MLHQERRSEQQAKLQRETAGSSETRQGDETAPGDFCSATGRNLEMHVATAIPLKWRMEALKRRPLCQLCSRMNRAILLRY